MQSSDINSSKSVELLSPTSLFADIYFLHLSITKHLNRCIAARDMRMEYPSIRVSAEADLSCDGLIYAVLTPCTSSAPTSSTKNIFYRDQKYLFMFLFIIYLFHLLIIIDLLIYAVLTPCTSSAPTSSTQNIYYGD